MNCKEVIQSLAGFLANEVTPSERKMIQNHLAACTDCQYEARVLAALQRRIRESLRNQGAGAAPPPQAWNRLQARLDFSAGTDRPTMRLSRLRR